jgi:hypothetical protein
MTGGARLSRRCVALGAAALLAAAWPRVQAVPAPGLGRLLISLPRHERAQIVELDRLAPLQDHADLNVRQARHDSDNRHYVKIQNVGFKQDEVTVYAAATGQLQYTARVPRVSDVLASPVSPGVRAFVFVDTASDKGLLAVVDLADHHRLVAVQQGDVGRYLHWWMPDGSLRRLHAITGELSAAEVPLQGANAPIAWQLIGRLAPPEPGQVFATAALSPDGQALLLSAVEPRSRREDLWMADPRGGPLQRITRDGFVSFVRWSPDARHLLLRRSNVSSINTVVQGQCAYWLVPASARDLPGFVAGLAHPVARQVFYAEGQQSVSLPCGQVATWLP